MNLLEQCRKWDENDEFQKIVDTLEAMPAGERTPEMDSELARAYNSLAQTENRELFEKAIALLKPHEEYFKGDHCWNYRMGYSYYYMDQEGLALRYFEQALEARPGDKDTQELIDDCRRRLALPRFEKNFRERTEEAWAAFSQIEVELREIIDNDKLRERGKEIMEKCGKALELAITAPSFELGFNGVKYELILSAEGSRSGLFPLVYFRRHAPASVLEHWNILVGRRSEGDFSLRIGDIEVRAEDVQVWTEPIEDDRVALTLFCEKLLPILHTDENKVWWLLSTLIDQMLGEVNAIALIGKLDVAEHPKERESFALCTLRMTLQDMGYRFWDDAQDYLENSYIAYELKPLKDPEADWRLDVYTGSSRLPILINEYINAESGVMDEYHKDGITAGFLCYPVDGFEGENRAEQLLKFRDALKEAIQEYAGDDAVTFLGGATGLYYGYLDFIAWDLPIILDTARDFFAETDLTWGGFHVFRRNLGAVRLWEQEKEPEVNPETGSLLSKQDIETLDSFDDGVSGYFGQMLGWLDDFIKQGVQERKFTQHQAQQDLQIALWYSFACNNLDEYRFYYKAAQWMKHSEKNAKGCSMWYYRYSVALMYCGQLEEALNYAEKGIQEEPDYPWIWLQAGKLRSHFGDKVGALDAVAHGLDLEPGDYEFLTLKKEIEEGAPLEQMEYHWINPDADQNLQQGLDEDADDKQRSISCITVNKEGLEGFWEIFGPKPEQYMPNAPFTQFPYTVNDHTVELVFQMNEGGMSKLHKAWLKQLKAWLQDELWLERKHPDGRPACLDAALVGLDYRIGLLYKLTETDEYFQIFLNPDGTEVDDAFWSSAESNEPELYTDDEMSAIEQHINRTFGEFDYVFHELVSPDIHVDICMVPPAEERNYCTLVTMGMGAHLMNVPEELSDYRLERAELAIALPPEWKLDKESMNDERWYWPVRLLKDMARLPILSDTWLGWGHTMDNQKPFSEDTGLCAAILVGLQNVKDDCCFCPLPDGSEVNFYQVIPLYRQELEYKLEHDAGALIEQMEDVDFVVYPNRPNSMDSSK